jgi:hypothetical protein
LGKKELQMINQGNNIPDKTIAIFPNPFDHFKYDKDQLPNIIEKSPKKRDWFLPHFYRCLPLTIGNQYGFVVKNEFPFTFIWDGKEWKEGLKIHFDKNNKEFNKNGIKIESHFGSGIITISTPFTLRTPPGVNLMTITPPNYVVPNITVMTGVVETDNLRRNFTFNLKVQMPDIEITIPAGTPLAAFIPIPRYFADEFELKFAEDIFDEDLVVEEMQAEYDAGIHRKEVEKTLPNKVGRIYFMGKDIYGNDFQDHQKP